MREAVRSCGGPWIRLLPTAYRLLPTAYRLRNRRSTAAHGCGRSSEEFPDPRWKPARAAIGPHRGMHGVTLRD